MAYGLGLGWNSTQSLHVDTVSWRSRVAANGGTLSTLEVMAADAQVRFIHYRGLRASCKRFNPVYGSLLAQAVPIFNDWGTTLDIINGTPTATTRGLICTPANSAYLRTGIIPFSQSGWNSQNSHAGVWLTEGNLTGVANRPIIGCFSDAGAKRYGIQWNTTGIVFAYGGKTAENATRNSRALGILSGHRLLACAGGAINYYEAGVSVASGANATSGDNTGWPNAEILIGSISNGGISPDSVVAGYHIGTELTAAQALLWAECMAMGAQMANRQETWAGCGDSLTSSSTWGTLLQTNYLPRRDNSGGSATGGIGSATLLANMQALIAANPSKKYQNWIIWIGQNDSNVGGWDGNNTISNIAAIRALFPHNSFRIIRMIPKNATDEYTGASKRVVKEYVNTALTSIYGGKALNITTPLIAAGSGSGQDLVDANNGVIPSSLKKSTDFAISAATQANPCVLTTTSHTAVAVTNDVVQVSGVVGMTELNGQSAYGTFPTGTTMSLTGVNSTGYTAYASGGIAKVVDAIHINATGDTTISNTIGASLPAAGSWV